MRVLVIFLCLSTIQTAQASGGAGPRTNDTVASVVVEPQHGTGSGPGATAHVIKQKKKRADTFEFQFFHTFKDNEKIVFLMDITHQEMVAKRVIFKKLAKAPKIPVFCSVEGKAIVELMTNPPEVSFHYKMNDEFEEDANRKKLLRRMLRQNEEAAISPYTQFHLHFQATANSKK